MPVDLAQTLADVDAARTRGRAPKVGAQNIEHWTGADFARQIIHAVKRHPAARRLAESEQEAVGQEVALRVVRAKGAPVDHGRAADVLAYVVAVENGCPRARRLARLRDDRSLARVSRDYLARAVSTTMESPGWQDHAARYLTATQRQRDTGPMISPAGTAEEVGGHLADAARNAPLHVAPEDVADLASAVALELASERLWTAAGVRRVTARLVQSMAITNGDDPAAAMLTIADGRSLHAVACDATRGGELLAEAEIPAGELISTIRRVAQREGLSRTSTWDRIDLTPGQRAAAEAVARLSRIGGSWDPTAIGTSRALPSWPERRVPVDAAPFPGLHRTIVQK